AVFEMVVAGRIVGDAADGSDDVAIAMIEAEASDNVFQLVAEGQQAPTEDVVAAGLEAAKPFIRTLCEAPIALAEQSAKAVREFPLFPDYTGEVFAAVEANAAGAVEEALSIADKQEREAALDAAKEAALQALAVGDDALDAKETAAAFRAL